MTSGPGVYDDICTTVRKETQANGAVVIIIDGNKGHGFSVQTENNKFYAYLPSLLETVAKQIRDDLNITIQ